MPRVPPDDWALRRLERLPLARLHRLSDWHAISRNEQRAVYRRARREGLDDGQRDALLIRHCAEVEHRAALAAPGIVRPPRPPGEHGRPVGVVRRGATARRRHTIPRGWVCWLGNRRVDIRAGWFRVTAQH